MRPMLIRSRSALSMAPPRTLRWLRSPAYRLTVVPARCFHTNEGAATMADSHPVPPTLGLVRNAIRRLIATGMPPDRAHDIFATHSFKHTQLSLRAQSEYAQWPQMVREGPVRFKNGAGTLGVRRSIAGFRAFIEGSEART